MKKAKPTGIESKGISASDVYGDFYAQVNNGLFNMGKPQKKKRKTHASPSAGEKK